MNARETRGEEMVDRYANLVYRLAFARTRSRDAADEIFQEVFLRYVSRQPAFDSEAHAHGGLAFSNQFSDLRGGVPLIIVEVDGRPQLRGQLVQIPVQPGLLRLRRGQLRRRVQRRGSPAERIAPV